MSGVPFHYVDLRAFAYVTEDTDRVERALRTFLPEEATVDRAASEGHYGDPIVVLSARVENADDVRHVLGVLGDIEDARILEELDERVDEDCSLHLRLDKQAASRGEATMGEGITLRAKVEAYPAKKDRAVENAREGLEPYLGDD